MHSSTGGYSLYGAGLGGRSRTYELGSPRALPSGYSGSMSTTSSSLTLNGGELRFDAERGCLTLSHSGKTWRLNMTLMLTPHQHMCTTLAKWCEHNEQARDGVGRHPWYSRERLLSESWAKYVPAMKPTPPPLPPPSPRKLVWTAGGVVAEF